MGASSSKKEGSRVTLTMKKEETTTDYHTNGTKTKRKTVSTCTLSTPDPESFKTNMADVKAIGYY